MSVLPSDLSRLYTPLPEAVARLVPPCEDAPGLPLPDGIPPARYAVFSRHVATPSHEVARFLAMAAAHELTPLFFEFYDDKFVTRNPCKFALARMRFADSPATNGSARLLTTVDIQAAQGRPIGSIRTFHGEPLVEFHHNLLRTAFPSIPRDAFFDGSAWFKEHGPSPRDYYQHFLSLFLSHCVLFESYLLHPDEISFTRDVVIPAFDSVCHAFGRRPLIVRIDPPDTEGHKFWLSYATSIADSLCSKLEAGCASGRCAKRQAPAPAVNVG